MFQSFCTPGFLARLILQPLGCGFLLVSAPVIAQQSSSELTEVVVVGQKIERSRQDTKESIAVVTGAMLEERNLVDLADVINQTPGVSTGNGHSFRIRGIDSGPIGTLRSELASYYVDGVALSGWAKSEGPMQMWDVSQIELMRGPQSTNLGRNSLAGAIVVHTMDPAYESSGAFQADIGNYGSQGVRAMGNLSLSPDLSALRLTYESVESDGYVKNLIRGEDDFAFDQRENVRLKFLLEPREDLRIVFSIQRSENEYGDNTQVFELAGYPREQRTALADVRGIYAIESNQTSVAVDYQISGGWNLVSVTAAMDAERTRVDDFDNTSLGINTGGGVVSRTGDDKNFSQELRFNFNGDQWRGSSGFYLGTIDADNTNSTQAAIDSEVSINAFSPGLGTTLVGLGVYPAIYDFNTGGNTSLETTNKALFTEWEYKLDEQWIVNFGARYDTEDQNVSYVNTGSSSVVLPDPMDWAILGPAGQGAIGLINVQLSALSTDGPLYTPSSDYDAFLPHIGLTHAFSEEVSTSVFFSRGYRAGGTEVTGLNTVNPYDPEYLDNIEWALRATVLEGQGVFNVNAYFGKWRDQQVSVPEVAGSNAFLIIENAGESKIAGVEMEFQYSFDNNMNLFSALGYNTTEFEEFVSGTNDYSGNEFISAPELTAVAGIYYAAGSGFFGGLNVTYQDESYANIANTFVLESHVLVNLNLGYENGYFKVEAYAKNLFDEDYAIAQFQQYGRMGAPAEYGARVTANF